MQTTTRANKLAASTKRGSRAKRLAITALHHGFSTIEGAREAERTEVKTGAKRFNNSEATQLLAPFSSYIPQSRWWVGDTWLKTKIKPAYPIKQITNQIIPIIFFPLCASWISGFLTQLFASSSLMHTPHCLASSPLTALGYIKLNRHAESSRTGQPRGLFSLPPLITDHRF